MKDPYETLGVSREASEEEIRKAFRAKTSKAHPDRGGSTEGQIELNMAYRLLTDQSARERYDRTGTAGQPIDHSVSEAIDIIVDIFDQLVDQMEPGPVKEKILGIVLQAQPKLKHSINQAEYRLKKLKRWVDGLKRRTEGVNYFAGRIEDRIKSAEQEIANLKHALEVNLKAVEILDWFEDGIPPARSDFVKVFELPVFQGGSWMPPT